MVICLWNLAVHGRRCVYRLATLAGGAMSLAEIRANKNQRPERQGLAKPEPSPRTEAEQSPGRSDTAFGPGARGGEYFRLGGQRCRE